MKKTKSVFQVMKQPFTTLVLDFNDEKSKTSLVEGLKSLPEGERAVIKIGEGEMDLERVNGELMVGTSSITLTSSMVREFHKLIMMVSK